MRLATFNLENPFERAAALNLPWDEGKPILEDYASLLLSLIIQVLPLPSGD